MYEPNLTAILQLVRRKMSYIAVNLRPSDVVLQPTSNIMTGM